MNERRQPMGLINQHPRRPCGVPTRCITTMVAARADRLVLRLPAFDVSVAARADRFSRTPARRPAHTTPPRRRASAAGLGLGPARRALKVARCGGLPLICCG